MHILNINLVKVNRQFVLYRIYIECYWIYILFNGK